ncbi:MAG: hypothetical protein ACK5E2_01775 [Burkholderiales bacterium]|jgi:hypothetical protein
MTTARYRVIVRSVAPSGQAVSEYLIVVSALLAVWIVLEQSPVSLRQIWGLLIARYGFSLSIPW